MKILLDENIDVRFKNDFISHHEVYTVRDMNWNGIKNGVLLSLLAENNFACWIVVDKNIPYQQNISRLPCMVLVLDVFKNTLKHLQYLTPQILEALDTKTKEKLIVIKEQ